MELKSRIYKCQVYHKRLLPKVHQFTYSHLMFFLDLDELPMIDRGLKLFSHNGSSIYNFRDIDHLDEDSQALKDRVVQLFSAAACGVIPEKVFLLANPRVFGYVFNPISVYYMFDRDDTMLGVVVEICNTFMERKAYVIPLSPEAEKSVVSKKMVKNFYISPYCKLDDQLDFRINNPTEKLRLAVNTVNGGATIIETTLSGSPCKLDDHNLLKYSFRYPLVNVLTMARIHWQALKLFLRGVPFAYKEDNPELQTNLYRAHKSIAGSVNHGVIKASDR